MIMISSELNQNLHDINLYGSTKKNKIVNTELLYLASILQPLVSERIKIIQEDFEGTLNYLKEKKDFKLLIINIQTFQSIEYSKNLLKEVTKLFNNNNVKIFVYGDYVLKNNPEFSKNSFKDADLVFIGGNLSDFVKQILEVFGTKTDFSNILSKTLNLDYTLLNSFASFQPVISLSSTERDLIVPRDLLQEISRVNKEFSNNKLKYYFRTNEIPINADWSKEFRDLYLLHGYSFSWEMDCGIELIDVGVLEYLHDTNLQTMNIDLGSACKTQLTNMRKTKEPEKYLDKADRLLKINKSLKIDSIISISMYIDETDSTLRDSFNWLNTRLGYINSITISPLTVYLDEKSKNLWAEYLLDKGCVVDKELLKINGIVHPEIKTLENKENITEIFKFDQ